MKKIYLIFLLLGVIGYSETELDINNAILREVEFNGINKVHTPVSSNEKTPKNYLEIDAGSAIGLKFTVDRSKSNRVSFNNQNFLLSKRGIYFSILQNFKNWKYNISINNDYIYSQYAPYTFDIAAGVKYTFDEQGLFIAADTKPVYQYEDKYYNIKGIKNAEQKYGDIRLEIGYELEDVVGLTLVYETPNIIELGLLGARFYLNYPVNNWKFKIDMLGGSNFLYHRKFLREYVNIIQQKPIDVGGYLKLGIQFTNKYIDFITDMGIIGNVHTNTVRYFHNNHIWQEYIQTNIFNTEFNILNLKIKPIENMSIDFNAKAYMDLAMFLTNDFKIKGDAGFVLETNWKYDINKIYKIKMTPSINFAFYKPIIIDGDLTIVSNIFKTPTDRKVFNENTSYHKYFNGLLRYTSDDEYIYNILGSVGFDFSYELTDELDIYFKTNVETNFGRIEKKDIDKKQYYRVSITPELGIGIKYTK